LSTRPDAQMVGTTSDGRRVARPLSPHLQIYKPQISSALSIFHRITGVALGIGTLLLVWWLVAAAGSPEAFAAVHWFLSSWLGWLVLFGWTAALFYHLCNGIRHLVWDAGYGFETRQVDRSGILVLETTATLTILAWIIGISLL
jgi:succinate dehydrogenase / fumarate reductase cytochrome b subunit